MTGQPRPAEADDEAAYYRECAAAIGKRDVTALSAMDFQRMRRGSLYANVEEYPKALDETLDKAMKKNDARAVAAAAARIIAAHAADIDAHLISAAAFAKAGRRADSEFHRRVAQGLLDSIQSSGNGTRSKPWLAFAVAEEWAFLASGGYHVEQQKLLFEGDRTLDLVRASNPKTNKRGDFYFDMTDWSTEIRVPAD